MANHIFYLCRRFKWHIRGSGIIFHLYCSILPTRWWQKRSCSTLELILKGKATSCWIIGGRQDNLQSANLLCMISLFLTLFSQNKLGDFFFDSGRFSRAKNVLAQMLRRNVRLVLEIAPFISTESPSFSETSKLGLLVKQIGSDIPALTSFKVSENTWLTFRQALLHIFMFPVLCSRYLLFM